jgi:flagellar motor switch/type III secretory pathway protein FliN
MQRLLNPAPLRTAGSQAGVPRFRGFICILAAVVLFIPCGVSQQPPGPQRQSILMPEANRPPDANQQMKMREQQVKKANYDAANAERQRQITEDSEKLLKLTTELKAEIGSTSKDILSISVIRKAEEIERLAHNIQAKMKLTVLAQ